MTRILQRNTLFSLLATAALLAGTATPVLAQDAGYVVEPWSGYYSDVKIQWWDQKIVVAGGAEDSSGVVRRMAIARYDVDGIPDGSFGSSGVAIPDLGASDEGGQGLVLQPDGKTVVSGYSNNTTLAVARFNVNGTVDSGFGGGGWSGLYVGATFRQSAGGVGLQSTGKVVVAGSFMGLTYPSFAGVAARFTASGTVDGGKGAFGDVSKGQSLGYTKFGYPNASFIGLAVQPDNKLVAVGSWIGTGLLVARYTANGALDKTFNGSGYSLSLPTDSGASDVVLQTDGKIVVVGQSGNDMLIARFLSTGALDASFGGGAGYVQLDIDGQVSPTREYAKGVAIQPDGKIVAAGNVFFDAVTGTTSKAYVARVNANGTLDATFGIGGFKTGGPTQDLSFGEAVDLQFDGTIIVAGHVIVEENGTDVEHPLVIRFDP